MKAFYKYPLISSVLLVGAVWYAAAFILVPMLVISSESDLIAHTLSVMGIGVVPVFSYPLGRMTEAQAHIRGIA
jgi:hypothetical protein